MRTSFNSDPLAGVLLDMDGVLVYSEPFLLAAVAQLFAEKGVRIQRDDLRPFLGTGEEFLLAGIAARHGVQLDLPQAKARCYALYLDAIPGRLKALPGVFSFLQECRRRQLRVALASSADAIKVRANLQAIELSPESFDVVVDGSSVARKKPHPDLFLAAAQRLGLAPKHCLVVEDAVSGVEAARAAGCRCLALTTSFPAERLGAADWIAVDLAHVPPDIWN